MNKEKPVIAFRVYESLKSDIEERARQQGLTTTQYIITLIISDLKREGEK